MTPARKIFFYFFSTMWLLSTGSLVLFAQNKAKKLYGKHPITIGFQTGKSSIFDNTPSLTHKKTKWANNSRYTLRAPINKHFKAETGINFAPIQNQSVNSLNKFYLPKNQAVSVPLTLQYYPLPHHCKVQPFCGMGLQYNCGGFNPNIIMPQGGENTTNNNDVQSGTKYISIIFAQGVTYEVNTKIQLTQSFHFIPESNNKSIGIGFGVGYTIQ